MIIAVDRRDLPRFRGFGEKSGCIRQALTEFRSRHSHAEIPLWTKSFYRCRPFQKSQEPAARHPIKANRFLEVPSLNPAHKRNLIDAEEHVLQLHVGCGKVDFTPEENWPCCTYFSLEHQARAPKFRPCRNIAKPRFHVVVFAKTRDIEMQS